MGLIMTAILSIGYWLPGKLAFSILKKELKEIDKQKRQENLVHMPPGTEKVWKAWEGRIGRPWQKLE
ncbi:MAG: hypothetical protein mread185_000100 [Mycoplasmataceae bacterium]|nr:MAG: hypothetical protein mread185_000100 [Mycoplasmataceae bacterium]